MQADPNQIPADQTLLNDSDTQVYPELANTPNSAQAPPPQPPEEDPSLKTPLPLKTIKTNLLRNPNIFVRDKKPAPDPENSNPLSQPTVYYLDKTHPVRDLIGFLSRELPSNSISEAPDVYPSGKLNILFENSNSSLKYTNELKNKENHQRILSKTDSAVILIQIAEDLQSISQEIIKSAQDKKATLTQNQQVFNPGENSAFASFKSIFSDISTNISRSPQQEINNNNKILTKDIKSLANYIQNYLNNFGELVIGQTTPTDQEEAQTPEQKPEEKQLPSSQSTSSTSDDETQDDGGGDDDAPAPKQPPQQQGQDKELGLIDAQYQNQVAYLSNASLIFLFASLSTENSQFDFSNSTNIDSEIRNELSHIGSSLVYDLILKYDGKDFNNPSTKLRIIQEASIKFQQDPRFRFYFQRVIDSHYLNLTNGGKNQEADEFSKKIASLTGENNQQFQARLEQFIVHPSTKEAQQANEQLENVSWDTTNTQTITLDNYHKQFSVILGDLLHETDPTKAQILANAIQDRIDFLISAHHGSFIEYLSIGKIEILIGQRIPLPDDSAQRDLITKNIKKVLADYWKLRVAEHTLKLNSLRVGQELQTITEEQKQSFANQSDQRFANYLESFHPPEMRQMSARHGGGGMGASFVAATNLSQDEIVGLDDDVKNEYHAIDVSLKIREYLARSIISEARKKGYSELVDQYVGVDGNIDASADVSDIQQDFYRNETRGRASSNQPSVPMGSNTPFGGYAPPSQEGSQARSSQNLDMALKLAGAVAEKYNPLLGKAVTWLSKKENRMIAGAAGATGVGILLSSLNTVGGWVGAIGGAAGGALVGGAIGSVVPLLGTTLGAVIGGAIGAVGGAAAGKHFIGGQLNFGGGGGGGGGAATIPAGQSIFPLSNPTSTGFGAGAFPIGVGATLAKTAASFVSSTAAQTIGATLATTTVGTLFIVNVVVPASFQVDFDGSVGSISTTDGTESKYAKVSKRAVVDGCNSLRCDNPGDPITITYSIAIEPKGKYTIIITDLQDKMALVFNKEILNPPTPSDEDIIRRNKTLARIKAEAGEDYKLFFDENDNIKEIGPGQALVWEYTETINNPNGEYRDFSIRNNVKVVFDFAKKDADGNIIESGNDTILTGERVCFGDCPEGLGCWPTSGVASQMPFGSFSHNEPGGASDAIDITGELGQNIYSPFDGQACYISCDGGYGCNVDITPDPNHPEYGYLFEKFKFAHLDRVANIFDGVGSCERVEEGTIIGYKGSTGNSTGVHLHFEMSYNGEWYKSDGEESQLLPVMPDNLTINDLGSAIRSCYDEK